MTSSRSVTTARSPPRSAARAGGSNFSFAHILGNGVRIDANLRSNELAQRLKHKLEDLTSKYAELDGVVETLNALQLRLDESRQEFLTAARAVGADAYGLLLDAQADIWTETEKRYGQGAGYKHDVAGKWREWFENTPAVLRTAEAVDARLQEAWEFLVLKPLADATRTDANNS